MVAVSVIVPVHNGEAFLGETERQLEALLGSTRCEVEVIVIDDHSTDGSLELISRWPYRLSAVRVLNAEGRGVARARNQAVAAARGDFVWFTDADDSWDPQIVQAMFDRAVSVSADLVVANATKIYQGGTTALIEDAPRSETYGARETLERLLDGRVQGHLWNKLFSRELLGADPFPLTRAHSDLGGVLSLTPRVQTSAALSHSLYNYVLRDGSILNSAAYRWQDLHDCLAAATSAASAVGIDDEQSLLLFKYRNVVVPVVNECLRRQNIMSRDEQRLALRESREITRLTDVTRLVRRSEFTLALKVLAVKVVPSLYAVIYRRVARAARVTIREAPGRSLIGVEPGPTSR